MIFIFSLLGLAVVVLIICMIRDYLYMDGFAPVFFAECLFEYETKGILIRNPNVSNYDTKERKTYSDRKVSMMKFDFKSNDNMFKFEVEKHHLHFYEQAYTSVMAGSFYKTEIDSPEYYIRIYLNNKIIFSNFYKEHTNQLKDKDIKNILYDLEKIVSRTDKGE